MGVSKRLIGAGATASGAITPSENFKVVTYTGNSSSQAITGVGFQPDLVWIKERSQAENHNWIDSTRGTSKILSCNLTGAQFTSTRFTSFDSDGFTLANNNETNDNGVTYVAWCWKANGGSTSSNGDGSITTTVQTNTDAGFSIIKYSGNGTSGATIGHNLGAVPNWFVVKKLGSGATNWRVYHTFVDTGGNPQNFNVELNGDGVLDDRTEWNDTMPTSSVISLNDHDSVNASGADYICYAWTDIAAFSNFSYYTGTGSSTDTPIIETGFEPAYVMIKVVNGNTGNWNIYDNARNTTNPRKEYLIANGTNAGNESSADNVDFYSNGFQLGPTTDASLNVSGNRYIYMAFAADPDTESPTLADSFGIKTYTGDYASTNAQTGLGFSPNLVWIKNRPQADSYRIFDTIRGATNYLASDGTGAEATNANTLKSFDSDGFTVGSDGTVNATVAYVAWCWKANDDEPTIFGGPAIAAYKFEDNANDVTGNFNGTANSITYATGNFNKAAVFNGSSSYVNLSNLGISGAAKVSVSAWINVDSLSSNQTIFQFGNESNKQRFGFAIDTNGSLYVEYYGRDVLTPTGVISTSTWYHVLVSYNGGSIETGTNTQIYVNGVAQTMSVSGSQTGSANLGDANYGIGYRRASSNQYFDGKIDQLRIYKGALKQVQVNELYAETVSDNDDLSLGGPPETLISANANSGFSIVKYKGDGNTNHKIPHGLSSAVEFVIIKNLNDSEDWQVFGNTVFDRMQLNSDGTDDGNFPLSYSATTITLPQGGQEANNAWNASGDEYIMYSFHSVTGYSKIGSYTGVTSGVTVTTGFRPDFLLIKSTSNVEHWAILDTVRGSGKVVNPNRNNAESDSTLNTFTVSDTGFSLPHQDTADAMLNENGYTYVYAAFKIN